MTKDPTNQDAMAALAAEIRRQDAALEEATSAVEAIGGEALPVCADLLEELDRATSVVPAGTMPLGGTRV